MWSLDHWVPWFGGGDILTLNYKGYTKSNRTQYKNIYLNYKLEQACSINCGSFALLQNTAASLLQTGAAIAS